MDAVINAGFKFEHAPGVFSTIVVARHRDGDGASAPFWELCIDSYTRFSPKQYSRQVFCIFGGPDIIQVNVLESGIWESMQNRTKLLVRRVA